MFREVRKHRRSLVYVKKSKEAKMIPNVILNQHFNWISTSSIYFFLNLSCQLPKTRLAQQEHGFLFAAFSWTFLEAFNIFITRIKDLILREIEPILLLLFSKSICTHPKLKQNRIKNWFSVKVSTVFLL